MRLPLSGFPAGLALKFGNIRCAERVLYHTQKFFALEWLSQEQTGPLHIDGDAFHRAGSRKRENKAIGEFRTEPENPIVEFLPGKISLRFPIRDDQIEPFDSQ